MDVDGTGNNAVSEYKITQNSQPVTTAACAIATWAEPCHDGSAREYDATSQSSELAKTISASRNACEGLTSSGQVGGPGVFRMFR